MAKKKGRKRREAETAIFPSEQLNNLRFPATREEERERERVDKRQHQYLLVKSNLPTTADGSINNPRERQRQTEKETVHRLTRQEAGWKRNR